MQRHPRNAVGKTQATPEGSQNSGTPPGCQNQFNVPGVSAALRPPATLYQPSGLPPFKTRPWVAAFYRYVAPLGLAPPVDQVARPSARIRAMGV